DNTFEHFNRYQQEIEAAEARGDKNTANDLRGRMAFDLFGMATGVAGITRSTMQWGMRGATGGPATPPRVTTNQANDRGHAFTTVEGGGAETLMRAEQPAAAKTAPARSEGNNAIHSAYQYELLKRDLLRQEIANPGDLMSGPVILRDPVAGATPNQVQQIRQYADVSNLSIVEGYMSPTGRVSTSGA